MLHTLRTRVCTIHPDVYVQSGCACSITAYSLKQNNIYYYSRPNFDAPSPVRCKHTSAYDTAVLTKATLPNLEYNKIHQDLHANKFKAEVTYSKSNAKRCSFISGPIVETIITMCM